MINTKEFIKLLEEHGKLEQDIIDSLLSVISTRGKNKGYILANCPQNDKNRHATWQALVSYIAPVRASVWSIMFYNDEQKEHYDKIDKALQPGYGRMIDFFEPAFRWNMTAHRYDMEKAQKLIIQKIKQEN